MAMVSWCLALHFFALASFLVIGVLNIIIANLRPRIHQAHAMRQVVAFVPAVDVPQAGFVSRAMPVVATADII
jgi:hypothetical protein